MREERGWPCTCERDENGNKRFDVYKLRLTDNKADKSVMFVIFRDRATMTKEPSFTCQLRFCPSPRPREEKQEKEEVTPT